MILEADVLIFGGGAAGLWTLDELRRRGYRALLVESHALGAGQTICAQGILHSGLKYALGGLLTGAADAAGEMTEHWRQCLRGTLPPDLSSVRLRSASCFLWRTDSVTSALGLVGAKLGLRTPAIPVSRSDRPPVLARCPGEVLRIDEPVVDMPSLLQVLANAHHSNILRLDSAWRADFQCPEPGCLASLIVRRSEDREPLEIKPRGVVLAAGAGNETLRERLRLERGAMQRRPLHMVMVCGRLPQLYGHCVDGSSTRVTLTAHEHRDGDTVWQVGGNVAEQGVGMTPRELIAFARRELIAVLPGIDLSNTLWATYAIDRAEGRTPRGRRPDGPVCMRDGTTITAWPTKLVLAPKLAAMIAQKLPPPEKGSNTNASIPDDWPRPVVASPPWETCDSWQA